MCKGNMHVDVFVSQLSNPSDLASNAYAIYQKLLDHLCVDHIDYALDMALQGKREKLSVLVVAFIS
jgi:hypothetical protein